MTKRSAALLVAGCLLAALTGCGTAAAGAAPTASHVPAPAPTRSVEPAADAGGACQLLDYEDIQETLGYQFSVAAASQVNTTFTCVTEATGKPLPDLTLSVTSTTADETVFKSTVQPKEATPVTGLGKIAYQCPIAGTPTTGPGIDVGWLAGNSRLLDLRLRLPLPATPDSATAAAPNLIALAKRIDLISI